MEASFQIPSPNQLFQLRAMLAELGMSPAVPVPETRLDHKRLLGKYSADRLQQITSWDRWDRPGKRDRAAH